VAVSHVMKKILALAGIAQIVLLGWTACAAGARLRVLTYNIHHGAGNDDCRSVSSSGAVSPDCSLDLDRIAAVIRALKPDIVGLQEVDRFWIRSRGVDQPAYLASALGMNVCFQANLDHGPDAHAGVLHQYGTAVLSRHPILECTNTLLPRSSPESEQRGLLAARIDAGGVRLRFYNTHLHTVEADRILQIPAIRDALGKSDGPLVLVGDLNATPAEQSMQTLFTLLKDAWGGRGGTSGFTSPAAPRRDPARRIDYILVSGDIAVSSVDVPVDPNTRMASDHYPVLAEIALPQ
jgi:endonuclease/exonuclease/phosphatase family metal-dependent hydrolase